MIKIKIEGKSNSGKTLTSMRIAAILQDEGYDVTIFTEPTTIDVIDYFLETPANKITNKKIQVCIHDTNNSVFNPHFHIPISLKGKL